MADKRKDITQEICDQVKFLIKGGATNKKAGAFVGLSATTISRIRTAGYSAEEFRKNNEARREEEKAEYKLTDPGIPTLNRFEKKAGGTYSCVHTGVIEDKSGLVLTPEGPLTREELRAAAREFQDAANQVPGQLAMDLQTYPQIKETDINKLLRFLAGKTDLLGNQLSKYDRLMREMGTELCGIGTKLDKLNDNMCQILRRMDK